MKIILDTNILIDAMQDNYALTWRIIDLILKDEILAYASSKIVKEYNLIIKRNVVREEDKEKLEKFFLFVNNLLRNIYYFFAIFYNIRNF